MFDTVLEHAAAGHVAHGWRITRRLTRLRRTALTGLAAYAAVITAASTALLTH